MVGNGFVGHFKRLNGDARTDKRVVGKFLKAVLAMRVLREELSHHTTACRFNLKLFHQVSEAISFKGADTFNVG